MKPQPVEMICSCDRQGRVRPLRFRFADAAQMLHVVQITEIVYEKPTEYVGVAAIVYGCRAQMGERQHLFELRYTIRAMTWALVRILY